MTRLRVLLARLRLLPRRQALAREAAEEIRFHLEMETEQLTRDGVPADEARRRAHAAFGGIERHREAMRDEWQLPAVDAIARDVRYAIRSLRRAPAFSGAVIVTLALGLAAAVAVFTVVDGVLLRPLPFPRAERIHTLWTDFGGGRTYGLTEPEAIELPGRIGGVEHLGVWRQSPFNLTEGGEPEQVTGVRASAGLFDALGVPPRLGRRISAEDDTRAAAEVVLISDGFWRRRFGADPGVVGRRIQVDGRPRTVVGVMGPDFRYPTAAVEMWVPLGIDPLRPNVSDRNLRAVVRLREGADVSAVAAEARRVGTALEAEIPARYGMRNVSGPLNLVPLRDIVAGDVRAILLLLFAGVALVLLIACTNVASLILVRHEARRHELALRSALGGSRGRLVQLAITETVVLSLAAGLAALLLASLGVGAFERLAPPDFPRLTEIGVRVNALAITAGAALLAGIGFGLLATAGSTGADAVQALAGRARAATSGTLTRRFHQAVVAVQLALTLALLSGAGLLLRSLATMLAEDPGFSPRGVLTGRIFLPARDYPSADAVQLFFQRLEASVAAVPGVRAAGATGSLPMSGGWNSLSYRLDAVPADPAEQPPTADHQTVTRGYFAALGIPLRAGRVFTDADITGALTVVVSEALARAAWPGEPAVGRRLHLGGTDERGNREPHTVVGVVGDVRHHGPATPPRATVYFPNRALPWGDAVRGMHLVARTEGDPGVVLAGVRRAVSELDPRLPLARVLTMEAVVTAATVRPRLVTFLLSAFAAAGLIIAAAGVFGVFAYTVSRRSREIGIRIALGAAPSDVRRRILLEALMIVGVAVAGGAILLALSSALLRSLLYGVGPFDPLALGVALGVLAATAFLASYGPALRASRTDPALCLRQE